MATRYEEEDRVRLLGLWFESTLSQRQFCQDHRLPERTLRSWITKYGSTRQPPAAGLRSVVMAAVNALMTALEQAEAQTAARHAAADDDETLASALGEETSSASEEQDLVTPDEPEVEDDALQAAAPAAAVVQRSAPASAASRQITGQLRRVVRGGFFMDVE